MERRRSAVPVVQSVTALELLRQRHRQQSLVPPPVLLPPPPVNASSTTNGAAPWQENSNNDDWLELGPGLHELAGEAGTGKTQIALSLCVRAAEAAAAATAASSCPTSYSCASSDYPQPQHAQSSSLSHSPLSSCVAIYLALGGQTGRLTKIAQRLSQMTRTAAAADCTVGHSNNNNNRALQQQQQYEDEGSIEVMISKQLMNSIVTRAVPNVDELHELLRQGHDENIPNNNSNNASSLSALMQASKVRILVLDSIADLFRITTTTSNTYNNSNSSSPYIESGTSFAQRAATLFGLAAKLKQLSDRYQVPILVINQVTGSNTSASSSSCSPRWMNPAASSVSFSQRPALGLSWAHCVTTSFTVTRRERHGQHQHQPQAQQHQQHHANNPRGTSSSSSSSYYFERHVRLTKSPVAPSGLCAAFVVTRSGVERTRSASYPR